MRTTRDEVKRLQGAGLSTREIANVLGITTQAVYLHLKALGLSPSKNDSKKTSA